MKKIVFVLSFFVGICLTKANAAILPSLANNVDEAYVIDDSKVESMFSNSTDITSELAASNGQSYSFFNAEAGKHNTVSQSGGKSAIAAIVLDFFLGGLGLHRAYLGTKTFTWIGYILTCGGIFGLVPFVDFIVLIINMKDISSYEGNPKFFMW